MDALIQQMSLLSQFSCPESEVYVK
jgi:hypothetical protein